MSTPRNTPAAPSTHRIPASYTRAAWRCTLPPDSQTGEIGIGLNVGGEVHRYALSRSDATHLSETLRDYLENCQSDKSFGSPSVDGSTPLEGQTE